VYAFGIKRTYHGSNTNKYTPKWCSRLIPHLLAYQICKQTNVMTAISCIIFGVYLLWRRSLHKNRNPHYATWTQVVKKPLGGTHISHIHTALIKLKIIIL